MEQLFLVGLHNAAIMAILAIVVWCVTHVWKNPPIAHLLWLLVLAKLVTPPLVNFDLRNWIPATAVTERPAVLSVRTSSPSVVDSEFPMDTSPETATGLVGPNRIGDTRHNLTSRQDIIPDQPRFRAVAAWNVVRPVLIAIWLCGAGVVALLTLTRVAHFHRLLAGTLPASERLQSVVKELVTKMGLRRVPDVRVVDCAVAPLVWCVGHRPKIILPLRLLSALDERQTEMVLAHELAHLRRYDHWVRILELIVSVLYWWNPLVWWVRRELHTVEEQCCDAWVSWVYPDQGRNYAESLLTAVEVLSTHSTAPVFASPFLNAQTLKERIVLVLRGHSQRIVSRCATGWLTLLAIVVIPAGVLKVGAEGRALSDNGQTQATAPNREEPLPAAQVTEPGANVESPKQLETSSDNHTPLITLEEQNQDQSPAVKPVLDTPRQTAKVEDRRAEVDGAIARLRELGAFVREFHPRGDPQYWVQIISTGTGATTRQSAENFNDAAMNDVEIIGRGVPLDLHLRHTSVTSTGLARLVSVGKFDMLELTGNNVTYEMLKVLPTLPLQGHLGLHSNKLTSAAIKPVSECQQLTGISLDGNQLGNACLEYLTRLPKLQSVFLGKQFTREAFAVLSRLENLTSLEVSELNPDLSDLKLVPKLQRLSLSGKAYNDETALTIAETFKSLEELYLRQTSITNMGVQHLSRLETLKILTLDGSLVTDGMADSIRKMKQLKWLSVENCAIGDDTLAAVSECPDLWYLMLINTPVTDKGIVHLAKFEKPLNLYLAHCKSVTDASIESLAKLPNSENLHLALWGSGITEDGFNRLKTALPKAQIRWVNVR